MTERARLTMVTTKEMQNDDFRKRIQTNANIWYDKGGNSRDSGGGDQA